MLIYEFYITFFPPAKKNRTVLFWISEKSISGSSKKLTEISEFQLSILAAAMSAYQNLETAAMQHCAIISSTSTAYSTAHYSFLFVAYVLSFVSLLAVYYATRVSNFISQVSN